MEKLYFTPEEAQKLLPKVKSILSRAMRFKQMLDLAATVDVTYPDELIDRHFDTVFNKEFHRLSYEFYTQIELLELIGVVVRDIDIGLVDFLSVHENREICLCFKLGEKRITHWHECDAGFTGRRPLTELEKSSKTVKQNGPDRI